MSEEHTPPPEAPVAPESAAPEVLPPQLTEQGPAEPSAAGAPPEPAVESAPEPEPAEKPALKPHTEEAGVLEATVAPTPEEKPAAAEAEPAKAIETAADAPAYEFNIPENFTVPAERLEELTAVMREANVPKEHAEKLWGMHTAAMEELGQHLLQGQHDAFADYRRSERNRIMSDPELGGAGFQTNQAAARRMLDRFTPPEQREDMNQWLSASGATDSYAFFRFLVNLAKTHDEPQGGPPPNPRPPAPRVQQGRAPNVSGGARIGYTHPRGGASS